MAQSGLELDQPGRPAPDDAPLRDGGGPLRRDEPGQPLGNLGIYFSNWRRRYLKDKAVKLTPLGEMQVNDRPALGLKIVRKDRPDVDLFLDKESKLPIKCQLRVKEPKQDQEVTHQWYFSGFKDAAGAKHPMKVTLHRDDKKLFELELSELKIEEKVDDSTFAMP